MTLIGWICSECTRYRPVEKMQNPDAEITESAAKCSKCRLKLGLDQEKLLKLMSKLSQNSKNLLIGGKVQNAEYNPGLGCVVKNKRHKNEILARKGLVEIGNDFSSGDRMQDSYEKKKKEELESKWKDV